MSAEGGGTIHTEKPSFERLSIPINTTYSPLTKGIFKFDLKIF
ncbi:hypothetical protein T11_5828 [Trichinella zimbabwensis]|uniref:Uncharacterized protein n=1 Tax=Trichinella zimbabwensis TaxID=268475 RepID=A0A0V1GF59_9BILA|nr:hypothetical protein T11_5828 [Trichinella zimbabwensis]